MQNNAETMDELIFDAMPHVRRTRPRHILPRMPLDILLVEDDPSDTLLTEAALDETHVPYELHTLENGAEVLPYLRRQGKYTNERRPDIVLLDLSLPAKDGFEVLAEMSMQAARFSEMPVVILTGDAHSAFLKSSYGLNIAAYVVKPCSAEKMQEVLTAIGRKHS